MKTLRSPIQYSVDVNEAALTMAIAVLVDRIRSLSKEDKDDLLSVSKLLLEAETPEDLQAAQNAFHEILDQRGGALQELPDNQNDASLRSWLDFVSGRIKRAREEAKLTQSELEQKTGLPQSHISRLENGVHSPSSLTLEKIANATNKPIGFFDSDFSFAAERTPSAHV
ncbi:MAG: helix-turn-helix transcriptional regulator [Planctomycetota bacterium]|nr:helix-turn-helix transcriptional regulator [Planctomycetota bacterium]